MISIDPFFISKPCRLLSESPLLIIGLQIISWVSTLQKSVHTYWMIATHYVFLKLGINSNQSLGQCFDIILIFFPLISFCL